MQLDWIKGSAVFAFLALVTLHAPPATAQTCCPAGCVQNGAQCVRTGPTPTACTPVACAPSQGGNRGTGSYRGGSAAAPIVPPTRGRVCTYPDNHNKMPAGSWIQSCPQADFQCNRDQDVLKAMCKSRSGELRKARLQGASTCADIVNDDGRLVCRKQRRYVAG